MQLNKDYSILVAQHDTLRQKELLQFQVLSGIYEGVIFVTDNFKFEEDDTIAFDVKSQHPDVDKSEFQDMVATIFHSFLKEGINQ